MRCDLESIVSVRRRFRGYRNRSDIAGRVAVCGISQNPHVENEVCLGLLKSVCRLAYGVKQEAINEQEVSACFVRCR